MDTSVNIDITGCVTFLEFVLEHQNANIQRVIARVVAPQPPPPASRPSCLVSSSSFVLSFRFSFFSFFLTLFSVIRYFSDFVSFIVIFSFFFPFFPLCLVLFPLFSSTPFTYLYCSMVYLYSTFCSFSFPLLPSFSPLFFTFPFTLLPHFHIAPCSTSRSSPAFSLLSVALARVAVPCSDKGKCTVRVMGGIERPGGGAAVRGASTRSVRSFARLLCTCWSPPRRGNARTLGFDLCSCAAFTVEYGYAEMWLDIVIFMQIVFYS